MFDDSLCIVSILIHLLPTDSVYGTGSDGVIDIMSFVGITLFHPWESLVIEFEHIARDSSTCTTADAGTIDMGFSESCFEGIESFVVHRRGELECEILGRLECWKVGMLECWKAGRLEGWKVGMLEGWKVGMLEGWKVGRLEGWKCLVDYDLRLGFCHPERSEGSRRFRS